MAIKRPSFNKFEHFKQSGFFLETFPERKFSSLSIFSTRLQNCNFLIFSSVQIIKVDGHEQSSAYFLDHLFLKTEKIL